MSNINKKIRHYLKLKEKAELALIRYHDNEHRALREYEELLIEEGCPHPLMSNHERTTDDGYGCWNTVKYKRCNICKEIIE